MSFDADTLAIDDNAQAGHRRAIARIGKPVTFVAVRGEAPNNVTTTVKIKVILGNYTATAPDSAGHVGAITQGSRHIIALQEDLAQQGFPLPVRKHDKVILRDGQKLDITMVDPHRRGFAGAIDIAAVGA